MVGLIGLAPEVARRLDRYSGEMPNRRFATIKSFSEALDPVQRS
jgi:hypothetical protein